jgi:magnesium dechelatase
VPKLNPNKLSIVYLSPSASDPIPEPVPPGFPPRRYTLTHNDLTAHIQLSIGEDYNVCQLSGWYTRLVRDEVCAEWTFSGHVALHLHCHVSGAAVWFAPARYRNYIFRREMPLVLDCIMYAERDLLASAVVRGASIFVHFDAEEVCSHTPSPTTRKCFDLI